MEADVRAAVTERGPVALCFAIRGDIAIATPTGRARAGRSGRQEGATLAHQNTGIRQSDGGGEEGGRASSRRCAGDAMAIGSAREDSRDSAG